MITIVTEDLDQADVEAAIAMFTSTPRLIYTHTYTHVEISINDII